MGLSEDAAKFLAWRKKGARRITPRFPRPYGWSHAERNGAMESMAHTVLQQFNHWASPGNQKVDVTESE